MSIALVAALGALPCGQSEGARPAMSAAGDYGSFPLFSSPSWLDVKVSPGSIRDIRVEAGPTDWGLT
jgi:hypothetical protein